MICPTAIWCTRRKIIFRRRKITLDSMHVIKNIQTYSEVSHSIRVVDVEPDDVYRVVQLLEHALHSSNIFFVFVIPSAINCAKRKLNAIQSCKCLG